MPAMKSIVFAMCCILLACGQATAASSGQTAAQTDTLPADSAPIDMKNIPCEDADGCFYLFSRHPSGNEEMYDKYCKNIFKKKTTDLTEVDIIIIVDKHIHCSNQGQFPVNTTQIQRTNYIENISTVIDKRKERALKAEIEAKQRLEIEKQYEEDKRRQAEIRQAEMAAMEEIRQKDIEAHRQRQSEMLKQQEAAQLQKEEIQKQQRDTAWSKLQAFLGIHPLWLLAGISLLGLLQKHSGKIVIFANYTDILCTALALILLFFIANMKSADGSGLPQTARLVIYVIPTLFVAKPTFACNKGFFSFLLALVSKFCLVIVWAFVLLVFFCMHSDSKRQKGEQDEDYQVRLRRERRAAVADAADTVTWLAGFAVHDAWFVSLSAYFSGALSGEGAPGEQA